MTTSARASRARNRRTKTDDWDHPGRVAAILTRVSKDDTGQQKSVGDQESLGREAVADHLWQLADADVYTDNDKSASAYAEKERPRWLALREAVRSGRIDVVVAWEVSR